MTVQTQSESVGWPRPPAETPAGRILDEAERLIFTLPNGKLRVVDVAAGLGMSHANVYRHFADRQALLDGLVGRWLQDGEARALAACDSAERAGDKLKAILLALHVDTRRKLAAAPGVIDVYRHALTRQQGSVEAHRVFLIRLCSQVLAEGVATGEFAVAVHQFPTILGLMESALRKFTHPLILHETLADDTPTEAAAVLDMFVIALRTAPQVFD